MEMIQSLKDLTSNILETMFFLTQETEPLEKSSSYRYAVSIKDQRLEIIIMFCERTARLMTENFLGTEEISEKDITDTLKECINIIVGNFVGSNIQDFTKKINIPNVIDVSSVKIDAYDSALLYYREEALNVLLKAG